MHQNWKLELHYYKVIQLQLMKEIQTCGKFLYGWSTKVVGISSCPKLFNFYDQTIRVGLASYNILILSGFMDLENLILLIP